MESLQQLIPESPVTDKLTAMLMPIGESGVGDDPCYSENFIAIKEEIGRLSNANYSEVVSLSEKILTSESKDLRTAGYYLLGKVFTEGVTGLLEAVELYLGLVNGFGAQCHPQREGARLQAIAWLNNEKVVAFTKNTTIESDEERAAVKRVNALIDSLNTKITAVFGDQAILWTSLKPWIEKNMPLEQAVSTDKAAEREQTLHISSQEVKEISSELALVRSAESIFAYLVKIGDWHRLIAMSRAMRWASITLPHNQDGRTQVLPPRESVVKEVQGAIVSDSPQEKIAQLELFYMEPGCQFFFDLQKHEADLTKAMGRADISKQIERQLRLLVEREPQILRLSYCDGTPFASERTRRWISAPPANALSKPKRQPEERDLQSMLNKIYSQVNPLDLLASIDQIDRIAANNDSEEFLLRLAKLEVCMKANRDDLALPLAEHLENDVVQYKLHKWDKSLALQVWDNLLVLLQKTDHKAQLELQRIDELKRKICTTDLGFALRTW